MVDSFGDLVKRIVWRLRWQRAYRNACTGLFFGIMPGILLAALDGTLDFPFSVLLLSIAALAVGTLAGAAIGFARRVDERALLIKADRLLDSHELVSTARELVSLGSPGPFAAAVVSDAMRLLSVRSTRASLEKRRPRLLPFLPLAVALLVLALLYPVDLRALFKARPGREGELVMLGQDLQGYGEKLLDAKRPEAGRSLALSEQLTQLGKELADRTLQGDEALDRIADMEGMLSREYELRMREALSSGGVAPQPGPGVPGSQGTGANGTAGSQRGDALRDLSDARDRLRDVERNLAQSVPPAGSAPVEARRPIPALRRAFLRGPRMRPTATVLARPPAPRTLVSSPIPRAPPSAGQAPGTSPAPTNNGPPTSIESGRQKMPMKEVLPSGTGDSMRLLVRALPEPDGARLSDQTVLNGYERQAESALAHDEIPLKLRSYVRDYFTDIGMGPAQ